MNAPVAETLKVIGSSSAMVSAGPMPGSTPIAVPRKQPSSAQPRLASVSALAKPRPRPASASMSEDALQDAGPDVHAQDAVEAEVGEESHGEADREVADRKRVGEGKS